VNTRLDDVNELLKLKKGDQGRLEHIKKALEKGTILFVSDSKYLKTLTVQYLINDTEKQDIKHNYESPAQTTKPKDIPTPKIEQPSENVNEAEPQKIESDKISFCGNCGNNMGSNSFCSKCGQSHTSSKLNSYCGNCGNVKNQNEQCQVCNNKNNSKGKTSKKVGKIILYLLGLMVIIIGIIFIAFTMSLPMIFAGQYLMLSFFIIVIGGILMYAGKRIKYN